MIFVSVPAYMEVELPQTVSSLVQNADHPESLHISIFQQSEELLNIKSSTAKITNRWIHRTEAKGAGYARRKVQESFEGEDYYFQIDAHSQFVPGWDTKYIESLSKLPPKSVISSWPMPYTYRKGVLRIGEHESREWPVSVPHYTVARSYQKTWIGSRRALGDEDHRFCEVGLGGQMFSRGEIVNEVPYDPRISWYGEEFLYTVRAYAAGWEMYGVNEVLMYHNYGRHGTDRIWNDRRGSWQDWQGKAMMVQSNLLNLEDSSPYQIVDEDRLNEYLVRTGLTDAPERAKLISMRV